MSGATSRPADKPTPTHQTMKTPTLPLMAATCAAVSLFATPLSASLVLFPSTTSEIVDGGPGDASGAANNIIVVNPAFPVAVPGVADLVFSGMIEYLPGGTTGSFGGVNGLRAIRITGIPAGSGLPGAGQPATLTNTSASVLNVPGPIRLALYDYTSLDPAGLAGTGDLAMQIVGSLDTTPVAGGAIANDNQRISLGARATTFTPTSTGIPGDLVADAWMITGPGTGPIPVAASALEAGGFNADPGLLILELDGLILGPNERYEFPASITVGVIPEPSTALLAALFPLFAFWRRTRG